MPRFHPLSEQENVRFAKDSHDVRNWSVKTRRDDATVGTVHDVILDENSRTRFLDVETDDGHHVLMPSGEARVDPSERAVFVPALDRKAFSKLPEYDHRPDSITPEYTQSINTVWDRSYTADTHHQRSDYSAGWAGQDRGTSSGQLARLDDLDDFEVADYEADPRGWEVIDAGGERIGKVDHLIGDTGAMKVRYMAVDLDDDNSSDRDQILLPVGHVRLDKDEEKVFASGLDRTRVSSFPRYTGGAIERKHEQEITRTYDDVYAGERQFEHPRYHTEAIETEEARVSRSEEELAVGTRERKAGAVDVHKRVETEHVRQPVNVKHEEVDVERRPVDARAAAGATEMADEEIRIPVKEEEVVVSKEPRVKEEIVVRKREVEETEMVDEEVRKERVDVERTDEGGRRR